METKSNVLELLHIKIMWLVSWLLLFIYDGFFVAQKLISQMQFSLMQRGK